MDYSYALNYLYTQLPMFQRTGPAAYKHTLGNSLRLDEIYGHPHRKSTSIHVAGTNGKGSVSHMLAAILQKAGYRTGLYTSPHLKDFRERIRIDGEMITESYISRWVSDFISINEREKLEPSFFELTVAMAFDYFADEKVDIAVIETGLGGRLDSTNIITPLLSVITNISFDHTALLGETLPLIAAEKAGIIKPNIPVVISQRQPEVETVFIQKAAGEKAPLWFASDEYRVHYSMLDLNGRQVLQLNDENPSGYRVLVTDLAGIYQRHNVPGVLKSVDLLRNAGLAIPDVAVQEGLADVKGSTGLLGRWQVLGANPRIICDTGHNEDGIRMVVEQINQTPYKKLHIVIGVVSDKDPGKVLSLLPKDALYYFCKADIPRAMDENGLRLKAMDAGLKGMAYATVKEAFEAAKAEAGPDDMIFVGGSTFVVAEIL
jgi:dihydrofolate synthase/folylpolyglutamate synthase